MNRSNWSQWLAFTLLFAIQSISAARTWTDRTGRTLEADFVQVKDNAVLIRRVSDGKQFSLPIDRLSDADQEFIKQQMQAAAKLPTSSGIWDKARAAKLSVPLGNLLKSDGRINTAAELDPKTFPNENSFDTKRAKDHFRLALEAINKPDLQAARVRAVAETSLSLTLSAEYVLYVFRESEESWPQSVPGQFRLRGVRVPSMSGPKLVESAMGAKLPRVEDDFLEVAIKKTLDDIAAKSPLATYDLILNCEKQRRDGTITGTLTGRLGDGTGAESEGGSRVKDVPFELQPCDDKGERIRSRSSEPSGKSVATNPGIQGRWVMKKMQSGGVELPEEQIKDMVVSIDDSKIVTFKEGAKVTELIYRVDPSQEPKKMTWEQNGQRLATGAYFLDNNELLLNMTAADGVATIMHLQRM